MYLNSLLNSSRCLKTIYHAPKRFLFNQALIVGCFKGKENKIELTDSGKAVNGIVSTKISQLLSASNFSADIGQVRHLYHLHDDYPCITVTGLGEKQLKHDDNEGIDQAKENVRVGVAYAIKAMKDHKLEHVSVDGCGHVSSAAEGATLSHYSFDRFKTTNKKKFKIDLLEFGKDLKDNEARWQNGLISGESQNFARSLMETPSNYKYPTLLANTICEHFSKYSSVETFIRDEDWAKQKKMDCFLSVGQGSAHSSALLELKFNNGGQSKPIVLVGKGITFDAGGISIKSAQGMSCMRGDMGGAACMIATLDAVVRLGLPVNLVVLAPLAENLPSGTATKPGDVFTAMNGKTVEVDDTDYEGRLALADALCYAAEFDPQYMINAATLTLESIYALGFGATTTFTTCNKLWSHLNQAGESSGDRMWRMPLYKTYTEQMKCSSTADLRNKEKSPGVAGVCQAAVFLKEFVSTKHWAHLDIAGVSNIMQTDLPPYLDSGFSGRPTRTLIETVKNISKETLDS